jgi:nitroreductase
MTMLETIKSRVSASEFDRSRALSPDEIRALVEYSTYAPSSFNIQHWRFVAVTQSEEKERLRHLAYGQRIVADAAVSFIVLGNLEAHQVLGQVLERSVQRGILDPKTASRWVDFANRIYVDPQSARDEAIRSASLAAMILMLAAEAYGLASRAISGFDGSRVMEEFEIPRHCVPVMLIAVGYPVMAVGVQKKRLDVDEVLAFHTGRKFSDQSDLRSVL